MYIYSKSTKMTKYGFYPMVILWSSYGDPMVRVCFWSYLGVMRMNEKRMWNEREGNAEKDVKPAKMAEKWGGMHFVFAYVKKKQYFCTVFVYTHS